MSTINIIIKQLQCLLKCQKMDNLSVKCVKNSRLLFDPTKEVHSLEMFTTDLVFS